jgi:hypothetical protein
VSKADCALIEAYKAESIEDVRAIARTHTKDAIGTLVKLMKAQKTPAGVKRQCAMDLLSQGWGRPDARGDGGDNRANGLVINILKLSTGVIEQVSGSNEDSMQVLEAMNIAEAIVNETGRSNE